MVVSAQRLKAIRGKFTLNIEEFEADGSGTALVGPNGGGKTTLLQALHGLIAASGAVVRPERTVSVFARPAVLRGSVLWNVAVVCEQSLRLNRGDANAAASEALSRVGLSTVLTADARTLSTGQRQRLALARALVLQPRALLLDEPFANIDADGRPALRAMIRSYVERTGCALVLATTSLIDAAALCENILVIKNGAVANSMPVANLEAAGDPYLQAALQETILSFEK